VYIQSGTKRAVMKIGDSWRQRVEEKMHRNDRKRASEQCGDMTRIAFDGRAHANLIAHRQSHMKHKDIVGKRTFMSIGRSDST
jgi:hypothetical protein